MPTATLAARTWWGVTTSQLYTAAKATAADAFGPSGRSAWIISGTVNSTR
ncbi:MAG: hypothetical protein ACQSGP_28275 [Frankia sp.]